MSNKNSLPQAALSSPGPDNRVDIEPWVRGILADPASKQPCPPENFQRVSGVVDARVFLRNTYGFRDWADGQVAYEAVAAHDRTTVEEHRLGIEQVRPVYEHYRMEGRILDNGGGAGTVREFLDQAVEFVSTDPWVQAPFASSAARLEAYSCLGSPLNFVAATAEFLPFVTGSFDWVHMRSMLDHVQVPDLVLLEARRVLRPGGRVLIGLYVEGGKSGTITLGRRLKNAVKGTLEWMGVERWKDHHVWHPTYGGLLTLISDNGLLVEDTYWQPHWNDTVCYVCARKQA